MSEVEYVIQRHKMSHSELRNLKRRPYFNTDAINECIEMGYNYTRKWWETDLRDNETQYDVDRFEILEFWGNIDKSLAEEAGLDVPNELQDVDTLQVNIWYVTIKYYAWL